MDPTTETAELKRLIQEARLAVRDKDYATAYDRLVEASVVYDTLPNYEQDGVRLEWRNAQQLFDRIERLMRQQSGAGKVKHVPVEFCRPDTGDGCCR